MGLVYLMGAAPSAARAVSHAIPKPSHLEPYSFSSIAIIPHLPQSSPGAKQRKTNLIEVYVLCERGKL